MNIEDYIGSYVLYTFCKGVHVVTAVEVDGTGLTRLKLCPKGVNEDSRTYHWVVPRLIIVLGHPNKSRLLRTLYG